MKSRFLFPHKWRTVGYILFAVAACFMAMNYYHYGDVLATTASDFSLSTVSHTELFNLIHNDIIELSVVIGLLLVGFSKEKIEDEQIAQIRLESLQLAIYCNYFILIILIITVNGFPFFGVLVYNVITPLIFFYIRFRWKIYQANRLLNQDQNI